MSAGSTLLAVLPAVSGSTATAEPGPPPATFGAEIPTGITGHPDGVATADVTGDGLLDVLVTTRWEHDPAYDRKLWVVPATGTGGVAKPVIHHTNSADPASENRPLGVAAGDVDGDGDADVVVAVGGQGVDVFLQEDGGGLSAPVAQAVPSRPRHIVLLDMDGDSDLDLVLKGDALLVAYNNGAGVFDTTTVLPGTSAVGYFEVGEFSGDDLPDIASCARVSDAPSLWLFTQRPGGGFEAHGEGQPVVDHFPACAGLAVADFTGDGVDDVVFSHHANQEFSVVQVWQQREDHHLALAQTRHVYDIPGSLEAADLNGDDLEDLVVVHNSWPALGVLLQDPAGGLGPESLRNGFSFLGEFGLQQAMTVADITGDGLPDVVTSNHSTTVVLPRSAATKQTVAEVSFAKQHITLGESAYVSVRVDPVEGAWPEEAAEDMNLYRGVSRGGGPWLVQSTYAPVSEPNEHHLLQHAYYNIDVAALYSGYGDYLPSTDVDTLIVHPQVTQKTSTPYGHNGRYALFHRTQPKQIRVMVQPAAPSTVRTVVQRRRTDGRWAPCRERSLRIDEPVSTEQVTTGTARWRLGDLERLGRYRVRTIRPADDYNGRGQSRWDYYRITR